MKHLMIMTALALALSSCDKKEKSEATPDETVHDSVPATADNAQDSGKQCYLQVMTGKANNGKVMADSIIFNIERQKGDSIWGIFQLKPAEKDKKISTFKGILKGDNGTVVANSNGEGMNYNEEVFFTLKNNTLAVKFGEMAEGKDGIWHYKDQSKLSEQLLDKVDCK